MKTSLERLSAPLPTSYPLLTVSGMGVTDVNIPISFVLAVLGLTLGGWETSLAQAPVGGRGGEVQELGPVLSNRPPVEVRPPPAEPTDKLTFVDLGGRLEAIIDPEHGYLKSLRFPALFDGASARNIDRYRMWYNTFGTKPRTGEDVVSHTYRVCYAESDDGIQWRKPNVGLWDWFGSKDNNIVLCENMVTDDGRPHA